MNKIVETYSRRAADYDDPRNLDSCWGRIAKLSLDYVKLDQRHKCVVDVGCGSGRELVNLARRSAPEISFFGVEPAAGLREIAAARAKDVPNVRILEGRFAPKDTIYVDWRGGKMVFDKQPSRARERAAA